MLSDEQMSKRLPFSLLDDEQMSNWVGVKHLPAKNIGGESQELGFKVESDGCSNGIRPCGFITIFDPPFGGYVFSKLFLTIS